MSLSVSRGVIVLMSVATFSFSQLYKDPNNLIKNGGFDDGAKSWTNLVSHSATGKSSIVDGQMVCEVIKFGIVVGKEFYDHQLIQENLTLTNGVTYVVLMDVKADVPRTFQFALESQNDEAGTQYALVGTENPRQNLTTTMQTFTRVFKMTKATANQVRLSLSFGATISKITVDNVCLFDSSKVTAVRPQILSSNESAHRARIFADPQGISFQFTDAAHGGYRICSLSGRVITGSESRDQGSASQYRVDYRSLGIAAGKYVAQAIDGNQVYSKVVSVMP
jgi:hypothetical protein